MLPLTVTAEPVQRYGPVDYRENRSANPASLPSFADRKMAVCFLLRNES